MSKGSELHLRTEHVVNGWEELLMGQLPPGWKLLGEELEGEWYAVMPDATPVVVAWGENPQELAWEIARKTQILAGIKRCPCSINTYPTCQCPAVAS
jgi:hypothetical protein